MATFLDAFKDFQVQLQTYMGWDTAKARTFVNNFINQYVVDLSSLNLDITASGFS